MRILHTSDWHLGINLHKVSLLDDQRFVMNQLYQIIQDEQIDVIVIAGDIYDSILASKEAIELYNEIMGHLCIDLKKQVIIIAGNHDSPTRLSTCKDLLAPMGLHILGKLEKRIEPIIIDNCCFYLIPYLNPANVSLIYQMTLTNQNDCFKVILDDIKAKHDPKYRSIVIAHGFIQGSNVCESDRFAMIGGSDLIDSKHFNNIDYVALGHLHEYQKIASNIYYSGSITPYSFSEKSNKYINVYDSKDNSIKQIALKQLHPLYYIKDSYQSIINNPLDTSNGYVKIEVEDQFLDQVMMNQLLLKYNHILAMSGKQSNNIGKISLDLNELSQSSGLDILKSFYQDMFEQELGDKQIEWYQKALAAINQE